MTYTHTYARLAISKSAYDEIRKALEEAGYEDQFHGAFLVDMHGIAIEPFCGKCTICGVGLARCDECGREWCLDHQPNPLVCPDCGSRPTTRRANNG